MTHTHIIENVRITAAERLNNTASGNPRWRLHTDKGMFLTDPDAQISYGVGNLSNSRRDTYAIGDDAPPVNLTVTERHRRVIDITRDGVRL